MKRTFGQLAVCAAFLVAISLLAGCTMAPRAALRVGVLKGPTAIGLIDLMQRSDQNETEQKYEFTLATAPDELVGKLTNHEVDIALIPTASAANVWQKSNESIKAININTLNTLYCVGVDGYENDLNSLKDKTVYMSGKGTTPEYVMRALFEEAHLTDDVKIQFVSEPTEAIARLTQAPSSSVACLPQPFATVATTKVQGAKAFLDVGKVWDALFDDGSQVVSAVSVVDTSFLDAHKASVSAFLEDAKSSVAAVLANPREAADEVVQRGIIESKEVAESAIPHLGIVSIDGAEMKQKLEPFYKTLYRFDPEALGGAVPTDEFYYVSDGDR